MHDYFVSVRNFRGGYVATIMIDGVETFSVGEVFETAREAYDACKAVSPDLF